MKKVSDGKYNGKSAEDKSVKDSVLKCVQPHIVGLAKKLFGSVITSAAAHRQEMFMTVESAEWHLRQRHPAGRNEIMEHVEKARSERICFEGTKLSYCDDAEEEKVGVYVAEAPFNEQQNYFEFEIIHMAEAISIGMSTYKYPLHKLPGWSKDSIGYHADDGKLFKARANGTAFGPRCTSGDRMGCGVKRETMCPGSVHSVTVFFTKNGKEVGSRRGTVPGGGMHPCVGLVGFGDSVRLLPNKMWPPDEDTHMSVDCFEDEWRTLYQCRPTGQYVEYSGKGVGSYDVGFAQATTPLNTTNHYFQLKIINPGIYCFITIGLTKRSYPPQRHCGWEEGSIAYHADDGRLFMGNVIGMPFAPPSNKGDIMGCGIIYPTDFHSPCDRCGGNCDVQDLCGQSDNDSGDDIAQLIGQKPPGKAGKPSQDHLSDSDGELEIQTIRQPSSKRPNTKVEVFFTKNGLMVGRKEIHLPRGGFYPSVSLGSVRERVKVDLHPLSG